MSRTRVDVEVPPAVDRFLDSVQTGDWDVTEAYLTPGVLYDASVPGWRYQYRGRARVMQQYREEWTGKHTWRFAELHVAPTADGVVVDFEARGDCAGDVSHPAHQQAVRVANIFRLEDGLIAEHRFYSCGEWDQETLDRMEREAPRGEKEGRRDADTEPE